MRCSEASLSVSLKPAVQTISYLEAFGQRGNSLPAKSNLSSPLFATRDVWSEEERLLWQARQFLFWNADQKAIRLLVRDCCADKEKTTYYESLIQPLYLENPRVILSNKMVRIHIS